MSFQPKPNLTPAGIHIRRLFCVLASVVVNLYPHLPSASGKCAHNPCLKGECAKTMTENDCYICRSRLF
jgi:hypothetical protein